MTRSAIDAALAYAVMAPNKLDHYYSDLYDGSIRGPPHAHLTGFNEIDDLKDVRIGVFEDWFRDADEKVVKITKSAVAALERRGATVVSITIPHLRWFVFLNKETLYNELIK